MWQGTNSRAKALSAEQKRKKDRMDRPLHIKRVRAEIKPKGTSVEEKLQITDARVLLNDISPSGMGLFSTHPQMVGQEVSITLDDPRRIFLRGRIIWCQEYDVDSHIISVKAFSYRVGIKFLYENPEEENAVEQFCQELGQDVLYKKSA